ncbi:MAG: hypothetical protein ABI690_03855 [Chloroflexota bacterium]
MESKPKRFKFSSRRIAVGLILFVLAVVVVIGVLWATNSFGWRKWRSNEVQQFIGADIPADARDIQFATDNQKTRIIWLRFSLPAETDVSAFVEKLGLSAELRANFTPFPAANPSEAAFSWWMPFSAQTFSGLDAVHDGKMVELLEDWTDPANVVIYLRAYMLGMN